MEVEQAARRIKLGESLQQLATDYRERLLRDLALDADDARPELFHSETTRFMKKLCRHLGDRHSGDHHVRAALFDWVQLVDHYEAFDALLSGFESFDGRSAVVERGRRLFPGPMTAHWEP